MFNADSIQSLPLLNKLIFTFYGCSHGLNDGIVLAVFLHPHLQIFAVIILHLLQHKQELLSLELSLHHSI